LAVRCLQGARFIVVHHGSKGPVENRLRIPGDYMAKVKTATEVEFPRNRGRRPRLAARGSATSGTARMKLKMAETVALAKTAGQSDVDQALETAAIHGRFANKDASRTRTWPRS
jgi:hypothetical protein